MLEELEELLLPELEELLEDVELLELEPGGPPELDELLLKADEELDEPNPDELLWAGEELECEELLLDELLLELGGRLLELDELDVRGGGTTGGEALLLEHGGVRDGGAQGGVAQTPEG